jgi:hypothetical protein
MTGAPDHHDPTTQAQGAHQPVLYPTNHVLAVLNDREHADSAVADLKGGGFMESEIHVGTGVAAADDVGASPGRTGVAGLLLRFAERIGIADEELETKHRYEQAMRDNHFVVSVATPTEERKDRAAEILRKHGGHTVSFFGKHAIEYITPPNR